MHAVSQISQENVCDATNISYKSSSLGIPNPCIDISELSPDDQEDLKGHISDLKSQINRKFLKLVADLSKSLKGTVTPAQLLQTLKSYSFSCTEGVSSTATFFQNHDKELAAAKEIDDILLILTPCFSDFNYELIEVIIDVHGADKDKENMQQYHIDFSEYSKKMPCIEFHEQYSSNDSKRTKIKFKLDYNLNQLKLYDVKHIQRRIAQILNLRPSVLYIHSINDGCMVIMFLIPTFFIDCLMDLIANHKSALQKHVKLIHVEHDHHDLLDLKVGIIYCIAGNFRGVQFLWFTQMIA